MGKTLSQLNGVFKVYDGDKLILEQEDETRVVEVSQLDDRWYALGKSVHGLTRVTKVNSSDLLILEQGKGAGCIAIQDLDDRYSSINYPREYFLKSSSNKMFKLEITASGQLVTARTVSAVIGDTMVIADGMGVKWLIEVQDSGKLSARQATTEVARTYYIQASDPFPYVYKILVDEEGTISVGSIAGVNVIDDNSLNATKAWSGSKIKSYVDNNVTTVANTIASVDRALNVFKEEVPTLYASKEALNSKANLVHGHNEYSTTSHNHDSSYSSKSLEHTHSNKSVIDAITSQRVQEWDNKQPSVDNTLPTSSKTISGSIKELFQNVSNGKTLIATAITDRGVSASGNDTFQQLADKIRQIGVTETIPVTGVSLSPASHTFDTINSTLQLSHLVFPSSATIKSVSWSSSNNSVATVDNGIVTSKSQGTATITVTTQDGNKTATCSITVTGSTSPDKPVTSVGLEPSRHTFTSIGSTCQLTASVFPYDATNKNVSFSTSNSSVATVSNTGLITSMANGNANVTVTTQDGNKTATCIVTVNESSTPPPTGLVEGKMYRSIAYIPYPHEDGWGAWDGIDQFKDYNYGSALICLPVDCKFATNQPICDVRETLINSICNKLEGMGIQPILKMHTVSLQEDGQGNIDKPNNAQTWFNNYRVLVNNFADIVVKRGYKEFIISNEMHNVMNLASNKQYMTPIISDVKAKGLKVSMSMNVPEVYENDGFQYFNELDFYCMNTYPSLTNNQYSNEWARDNFETLRNGFYTVENSLDADYSNLFKTMGGSSNLHKEIWLTEVGANTSNKTLEWPAYWGDSSDPKTNYEGQKHWLHAVLDVLEKDRQAGKLPTRVSRYMLWDGNYGSNFNPIGKMSQEILDTYWKDKEAESDLTILMSNENIRTKVGNKVNLIPIMYPVGYPDKRFEWSSSNSSVASVNTEGLVTATGVGDCKIIAKHTETQNTVECSVSVTTTGVTESIDPFKSKGVLVSSNRVVLNPSEQYQIYYNTVPLGGSEGVTFRSTNESIATVSSTGNIQAKSVGETTISAISTGGGLPQKIQVVVSNLDNTGTSLAGLTGATHTDKIKKAFTDGGIITGNGSSYSLIPTEALISTNVVLKNSVINGTRSKTNITLSASNKSVNIQDCTLINTGFWLSNFTGSITFERCTFEEWKYCPVTIMTSNVTVEFIDCVFKDNTPNSDEWIANTNWERFWAYNPINIYGNNVVVKVNGCTFNNIMSRCVIYAKDGYNGSTLEIENNTFYRTEGHVINMESSCSGYVKNNDFYLVGDLRGTICHETEQETGVGGNCVFVHGNAVYSDVVVSDNVIRYTIENGIEGGLKEVCHNYIEGMGYRYSEGIINPSMEGIWGSARNGIHSNVIVNPNMDGIRIENQGFAGNVPCKVRNNVILHNSSEPPRYTENTGVSVVSREGTNRGIDVVSNSIIGFKKITKIDGDYTPQDYNLQQSCGYAYSDSEEIPPTPSTGDYSTLSLMYPMPQPHGAIPNGAPDAWRNNSRWENQYKPDGWSAFGGWAQVYRVENTPFSQNTGVEIKDYKVYGWKNNQWNLVTNFSIPYGAFYAEDFKDDAHDTFPNSRKTSSTGDSVVIRLTSDMTLNTSEGVRNVCYHPFTHQMSYDVGFEYIYTCVSMRKVKWNESGIDDRDNSKYCASCGGDWWREVGLEWAPDWSNNKGIAQPKIMEVKNDWETFSMSTVPQNWSKGFPGDDTNYFDINATWWETYECTHTLDKTNKSITISSDRNVNKYYGYLVWDISKIREGRRYRLTCKSSNDMSFVRFRVDGRETAIEALKNEYSIDFTGVNAQEKLVDICLGIRHPQNENIGLITTTFSDIQIIDLDGEPEPLPESDVKYDVVDYKIIVKQNGITESYHSCEDIPRNLNGNGGVDGYKLVIKDRIKHYLSLTNGYSDSKITIDGMKPFNYTYIDQEYKDRWIGVGYSIYHNTLKFSIANRVDKGEWGDVEDRTINPVSLERGIRIFNCALPGYMEITHDQNSPNSVSEGYFETTWLGICRLNHYQGEKFHIHQNIKLLGGFGNSTRFYVSVLVHEMGHITGIPDNSLHYPTSYLYNKENREPEWLQPSDIAHIQDKFPHLTGKSTEIPKDFKKGVHQDVVFSFMGFKDEDDMLDIADTVITARFVGAEDEGLYIYKLNYNLYNFEVTKSIKGNKQTKEIVQIKEHESINLGLEEGNEYKLYLSDYEKTQSCLLNPSQAIIKL